MRGPNGSAGCARMEFVSRRLLASASESNSRRRQASVKQGTAAGSFSRWREVEEKESKLERGRKQRRKLRGADRQSDAPGEECHQRADPMCACRRRVTSSATEPPRQLPPDPNVSRFRQFKTRNQKTHDRVYNASARKSPVQEQSDGQPREPVEPYGSVSAMQKRVSLLEKRMQAAVEERCITATRLNDQKIACKTVQLESLEADFRRMSRDLSTKGRGRSARLAVEVGRMKEEIRELESERDRYRENAREFQHQLLGLGLHGGQSKSNGFEQSPVRRTTNGSELGDNGAGTESTRPSASDKSGSRFNSAHNGRGSGRDQDARNAVKTPSGLSPPPEPSQTAQRKVEPEESPTSMTNKGGINMEAVHALREKDILNDHLRGISLEVELPAQLQNVLDLLRSARPPTETVADPTDSNEQSVKVVKQLVENVKTLQEEKSKAAIESYQMETILRKTVAQLTQECQDMKREAASMKVQAQKTSEERDLLQNQIDNAGIHIEEALNAMTLGIDEDLFEDSPDAAKSSTVGNSSLLSMATPGSSQGPIDNTSERPCHPSDGKHHGVGVGVASFPLAVSPPIAKCFALVEETYPRINDAATEAELLTLQRAFELEIDKLNRECGKKIFSYEPLSAIPMFDAEAPDPIVCAIRTYEETIRQNLELNEREHSGVMKGPMRGVSSDGNVLSYPERYLGGSANSHGTVGEYAHHNSMSVASKSPLSSTRRYQWPQR